jgi:hypothetical protein
MRSPHRRCAELLVIALLTVSGGASAQDRPTQPSRTDTSPRQHDEKLAEARARYERGIKLYDDGAYDASRSEFERAYALVPSYKLLYNIGLVKQHLSDYVGALKYLQQYQAEGGDQISADRRAEIAKLIAELQPRIGRLQLRINEPNATVAVDDVVVDYDGRPLPLNPGRRRVTVSKSGKTPLTKAVDIVGSETAQLDFQLTDNKVVVVVDNGRRVPWGWWIATGLMAAGAAGTGLWALSTKDELREAKEREAVPDPSRLDSLSTRSTILGVTTDALIVGAAVSGIVATYLTVKWGNEQSSPAPGTAKAVRVVPTPRSLSLAGTF